MVVYYLELQLEMSSLSVTDRASAQVSLQHHCRMSKPHSVVACVCKEIKSLGLDTA